MLQWLGLLRPWHSLGRSPSYGRPDEVAPMRGHITRGGSKSGWTVVLNMGYHPLTGRRRQKWVAVKGPKRNAERKLAELLHQMDTRHRASA